MTDENERAAAWLRRYQGIDLEPAALASAEAAAARQAALTIEAAGRSAGTLPFETEPAGLLRLLELLAPNDGADGR